MIATIVFFAKECMFKGMLVGDVWVTAMSEGTRQVFVGTGAWFKDMEFVGSKGGGSQERAEEAGLFGRIQDGCWDCWRAIWFAFIPESSLCL